MFSEDIEILMTLLQNVSKSWVGSGGGDGGVDGCVGGGCVAVGGVGGEGGVLVVMVLLEFCSNFNVSRKLTISYFGHISVEFCSNSIILDIFQQPRQRAFKK